MVGFRALAGGLAIATGIAPTLGAQPLSSGLSLGAPVLPDTPLLTLDQDRLFAESAFGRRVARELDVAFRDLAQENETLKQTLEAEERRLTAARATLSAEDFRTQADAFDERVIQIRTDQDGKERALQRRADQERQVFLQQVLPTLAKLVSESGAVAILDERAVFLALDAVDITDEAIRRVDAEIGEGIAIDPARINAPSPPLRLPSPDPETTGNDP